MKKIAISIIALALLTGCKKDEPTKENSSNIDQEELLVTLNTLPVETTNGRGAVVKSNISYRQDVFNIDLGVCWSTSPSPTVDNQSNHGAITFTNAGNQIQAPYNIGDSLDFSTVVSGLLANTKYYIRSFVACAGNGIAYGNEESFTTASSNNDGTGVIDFDDNNYKTVIIGNQEWMAENLRASKYANGDSIIHIEDSTQWSNSTSGAFCWKNNNEVNETNSGKIYNWHAITDARNICPSGWHVANKNDWDNLVNQLKTDGFEDKVYSALGSMHDLVTGYYGFNSDAGSVRYSNNPSFEFCNTSGTWWSIEENDSIKSGKFFATMENQFFGNNTYYDPSFNVRCVKD